MVCHCCQTVFPFLWWGGSPAVYYPTAITLVVPLGGCPSLVAVPACPRSSEPNWGHMSAEPLLVGGPWDRNGHAPLPPLFLTPRRSVFSLLLRQLDAESLLGGGGWCVQREGLGLLPGSSRFLEGRLEGGSGARTGGLGGLYGLSPGPWASGQREAPSQSLL